MQKMQEVVFTGMIYSMDKTQKTEKGEEIPIAKRKDFLKNLKKVATPKPSTPSSPKFAP